MGISPFPAATDWVGCARPVFKKEPENASAWTSVTVGSQEPALCSGSNPPPPSPPHTPLPPAADQTDPQGAAGPLGFTARGTHLAEAWCGGVLGDPDTHAEGHRPDRERREGREIINQMLLIFFKRNYKTLSISISIYSQGLLN